MKKYSFVETLLSLTLTVLVLKCFDAFREVIKQRCTPAGLCAEISVEGLADSVQPGLFLIPIPVGYRIDRSDNKNEYNHKCTRDY
jgi:hypothetical protein